MLDGIQHLLEYVRQQNQWVVALYVFLGTIALLVLKSWWDGKQLEKLLEEENKVGG